MQTRAGLDRLVSECLPNQSRPGPARVALGHTSPGHVVNKNQQGSQLEIVNHLSLVIVLSPFLSVIDLGIGTIKNPSSFVY